MISLKIFKIFVPMAVIFLSILIYIHMPSNYCQQFSQQAQSFIGGKLDISAYWDTVYKDGKYFWPQGPFPSLILIPFQLIYGPNFDQFVMQPILVIILSLLLYQLARLKNFEPSSAIFLTYVFLFASQIVRIIVEPCYSYFAHVVTMVLLTALLLEFESKKRPLFLGLLLAAIIATRISASLIFIPIIYYFYSKNNNTSRFMNITLFINPILLSIFLLLIFNQVRFQNPFDNGYATNNVGDYLAGLRNIGVFSIQHIPSNFYYYFLISVQPVIGYSTHLVYPFLTYSPYGLSFFIVAPFFLYAFKSLKSQKIIIRLYWLVILLTLLILLSYYSNGWVQFGPRFLSDVMPILYLLLLVSLKAPRLTQNQIIFIILSSLLNIYLLIGKFFTFKN
ncbi:hypothetical protein HYS94_02930 [Candidatus Daviesbacteria bacterium]|nr:hypothetical protein [Candidatus Daviesbacteria bacterium]